MRITVREIKRIIKHREVVYVVPDVVWRALNLVDDSTRSRGYFDKLFFLLRHFRFTEGYDVLRRYTSDRHFEQIYERPSL
jgi:hypothetical protein